MAYVFPAAGLDTDCALLAIPSNLVPIVAGLFSTLQYRAKWISDADYSSGRKAFAELEAQLVNACFSQLIQEIRDARGVAEVYEDVPTEDRTSDMYRSLDDLVRRLNTIIFALDGGLEHDDSILQALRGDVEADATRNVMEALA